MDTTQIVHATRLNIFLTLKFCFYNFSANNSKRDFDYNTVKLCFQAIIKDQQTGHPYLFQPVVSDNVPDKSEYCGFILIL